MDYKALATAKLAERAGVWNERNALVESVKDGQFTAEQRQSIERMDADMDRLHNECKELVERGEREADVRSLGERVSRIVVPSNEAPREPAGTSLEDELRRVALQGGSYEIKGGPRMGREARAVGTGGTSANFTNDQFVAAVILSIQNQTSVLKAGATPLPTNSGEQITAPSISSIGSVLTAETVALPATATAANKVLNAFKYGAIVDVTRELVEDTGVDLSSLVAELAGDNVAGTVNVDLLVGNGSSKPRGVLTDAVLGATAAGAAAVTANDAYLLYYSLNDQHRNKGAWIMAGPTAAAFRTASSTLWQAQVALDQPELFLGRPVITDANMPAIGTGNKIALFGNFAKYYVRQVRGLRVEQSSDYKFNTDLIGIKVVWRGDGLLTDTSAVKHLKNA